MVDTFIEIPKLYLAAVDNGRIVREVSALVNSAQVKLASIHNQIDFYIANGYHVCSLSDFIEDIDFFSGFLQDSYLDMVGECAKKSEGEESIDESDDASDDETGELISKREGEDERASFMKLINVLEFSVMIEWYKNQLLQKLTDLDIRHRTVEMEVDQKRHIYDAVNWLTVQVKSSSVVDDSVLRDLSVAFINKVLVEHMPFLPENIFREKMQLAQYRDSRVLRVEEKQKISEKMETIDNRLEECAYHCGLFAGVLDDLKERVSLNEGVLRVFRIVRPLLIFTMSEVKMNVWNRVYNNSKSSSPRHYIKWRTRYDDTKKVAYQMRDEPESFIDKSEHCKKDSCTKRRVSAKQIKSILSEKESENWLGNENEIGLEGKCGEPGLPNFSPKRRANFLEDLKATNEDLVKAVGNLGKSVTSMRTSSRGGGGGDEWVNPFLSLGKIFL